MERKKYLILCQKCAVLTDGIFRIKQNVPEDCKVKFNDLTYYPKAYVLRFGNDGKAQHIAVLHDLRANSETYCDLERVEENV